MYITHDEILGAFFKSLLWNHVKGALPASALYIEFFTLNKNSILSPRFLGAQDPLPIKVRILFNETVNNEGEDVKISN